MDFGIANHCQRAGREQAAQIAIALLADTAEPVLAPARVLLRHEPDPGREIPSRSESLRISNAGDQSGGQRGTNARNLIEPLARRVGSMPGHDPAIEVQNLRLQRLKLNAKRRDTGAGELGQPLVPCVSDDIAKLFDTIASDTCDDAKLGKMGTDHINHRRLLANEQMARA